MSFFHPFDVGMFLNPRPAPPPYTPPRAPDISGLLGAIGSLGDSFLAHRKMAQEKEQHDEALAAQDRARLQQAATQASEQQVQMRGQDLSEQARKDTNSRLDRTNAEKYITDFVSTGDPGAIEGLKLAAHGMGWSVGEEPSSYQAPDQGQPSADNPKPPAASGDFDSAYQRATQKESGGNPRAVNPTTGALGAFQLMPDQLPKGMTKEAFLGMTPEQQKDFFVNRYLPSHGLSRDTLNPADVGLSIGAPTAIGKTDDSVIYPKGSPAVKANPSWDRNKDGQITAGELRANYGALPGAGGGPSGLTIPDVQMGKPGEPVPEEKSGQLGKPPDFLSSFMASQYDMAPGQTAEGGPLSPMQKPGTGGKIVIRDDKGQLVHEIDLPAIRARQAENVRTTLSGLIGPTESPEKKKVAEQAMTLATAPGAGLNQREAILQGLKFYQEGVTNLDKNDRAHASSDFGALKATGLEADKVLGTVSRDFKLPALNAAETDITKAQQALADNSGFGDVTALRSFLHSLEGRTSDQDYNSVVNSAGLIANIENAISKATEGRLPPEVSASLRRILDGNMQVIRSRKTEAAQRAQQLMQSSVPYASPELTRQQSQRISDYFGGPSSGPSDSDLVKGLGP